jgi:electron transfer flavoprotein alpha subunit
VSLELAGEAARLASLLGGEAVSVLMGSGITPDLCEQLARHGTPRILLADDPRLDPYSTDTYAWVLAEAITRYKPRAVLLPATSFGRDFAPRVAARLGLGLTGDCTGFELDEEGRLLQLKPAFGGQVLAPIISRTLPVMSTVRPGMLPVYAPAAGVTPHIERLNLDGLPAPRLRVLSATTEGQAGLALDSARLIVCVGTGIGGPHTLPQIEQLAQDLGSWMGLAPNEVAVGGTRKVVDEGWLPRHQQIGITGHAVAPDLYVALALQGNFNHTAGILRSGTIVAVNTDPEAPIFTASDFNIPTDWQAFATALHTLLSQSPPPRPMARNLRHT